MAKSVAIVQSNYIPWKGYFDLIARVDEFILYDDVQYTRRDWRNRNRIKTREGVRWLTIPVEVRGRFHQRIDETRIAASRWREAHWESIRHAYSGTRYFAEYREFFEELYCSPPGGPGELLSEVNRGFLRRVCDLLGIGTPLRSSSEYLSSGYKTERLISLCRQAGATEYVSGPSAKAYLQPQQFEAAGIRLSFMDYAGYPEYEQLFPPFEHSVSIVDLIFNTGPSARTHLKFAGRASS